MKHVGLDIGTKTIVAAFDGPNGVVSFVSEINGYWFFDRSNPFVEAMLSDPTKRRADGTARPASWFKMGDRACVLGRDAEELAFAKNDTLRRPMASGAVCPDEDAMTVLATIVHGMLETVERDVGKFDDVVKVCYSTTADAINADMSVDYHRRVLDMVVGSYKSDCKLETSTIKESHAIVLAASDDATGIGISWGAGTVTVSYVMSGIEMFSFCWVGAGDWIDNEVALRHGYQPDRGQKAKTARETPTTVCRRKHEIDLTPNAPLPTDRLGLDVLFHYDALIERVIEGVVLGIAEQHGVKFDGPVTVYMAGGTSMPTGFAQRVAARFDQHHLSFDLQAVRRLERPLQAVAEGCLKAAKVL